MTARATVAALALAGLLAGCRAPTEAAWLEGFGYGWETFNHRVSHLTFGVVDDQATLGVVGGTSTTGIRPDLPAGCDADACSEFPFDDDALAQVHWARTTSRRAAFGVARAEVVAEVAPGATTVRIPLSRRARGEATAVLQRISVDTDHPLSEGGACYDPVSGWLPRRIALEVAEPALVDDGEAVEVEVSAAFEAGASLEDERACLDEVFEQARVPVEVDVLAVAGRIEPSSVEVAHGMEYSFGCDGSGPCVDPDPQPDPDLAERPLALGEASDPLVGWSRIDFRFHADDPDRRGAYLRTLSVIADPRAGVASGHATNYSPVTQQSGFDYAFEGTVQVLDVGGAIERGTVDEELVDLIGDDGGPLLYDFDL